MCNMVVINFPEKLPTIAAVKDRFEAKTGLTIDVDNLSFPGGGGHLSQSCHCEFIIDLSKYQQRIRNFDLLFNNITAKNRYIEIVYDFESSQQRYPNYLLLVLIASLHELGGENRSKEEPPDYATVSWAEWAVMNGGYGPARWRVTIEQALYFCFGISMVFLWLLIGILAIPFVIAGFILYWPAVIIYAIYKYRTEIWREIFRPQDKFVML